MDHGDLSWGSFYMFALHLRFELLHVCTKREVNGNANAYKETLHYNSIESIRLCSTNAMQMQTPMHKRSPGFIVWDECAAEYHYHLQYLSVTMLLSHWLAVNQ